MLNIKLNRPFLRYKVSDTLAEGRSDRKTHSRTCHI